MCMPFIISNHFVRESLFSCKILEIYLHNSGIYLNFDWVHYTLPLHNVWIFHWNSLIHAGNLQPILPFPGLAQCDGSHPSHLDFKQQENERKIEIMNLLDQLKLHS